MFVMSRRGIIGAAALALAKTGHPAAAEPTAAVIGWPSDVTSWDPNQRFVPDAQSIYKAVFDQPLNQSPDLKLIPWLVTNWALSPDGRTMPMELRDDVKFHDGSVMTAEDFRYTFFDRTRPGQGLDISNSWRKVSDIEILSATKVVMHFSSAAPTAPQWLAFLGSFVVPKAALEKMGAAAFAQKPVGSGPYRVAEYEMNSRIVLERFDGYWGPKPPLARVTIQIIKDPSARVAAIQSGQADLVVNVPIRDVARLGAVDGLAAEAEPITRIVMLHVRNDKGFADARIRLAANHAIDKAALSKAFFGGAAKPLSVFATPGSPGDVPGFTFGYDPDKAKALLAEAGFSLETPVKITLGTTNGHFPSDYDLARAIVQMWHKAGIDAELQVIEYAKYFELNRSGQLPEAMLYTWDNATADPEIFIGYNLNPNMPFSPSHDAAMGARALALFDVADYDTRVAGYRALAKDAVEQGLSLPLLQSVVTLAYKKKLAFPKYGNGWVLPQSLSWA